MSGLKCKVEVGQLQIDGLLAKFNGGTNTKVKTTKKTLASLDSLAKQHQKKSKARSDEYVAKAKAEREKKKAEKN